MGESMPRRQPHSSPAPAAAPKQLPEWLSGRWAWRVAAAVGALFVVFFTVPWQPADEAPIGAFDFSWMLLLHDAVATGRQFGKEIILPQGPMGFFGTSVYDPRTFWVLILLRIAAAAVVFRAIWRAATKLTPHPLAAAGWTVATIALIGRSPDHFFPACSILLLLTYFVVNERKLDPAAYALLVVIAAASLIKVNQPFYAAVSLGAVTLDRIWQRDRRFFLPPLAYPGAVALFYFAARQRPSSIGAFVWGWWQVTLGHADAVGLPGPWVDAAVYVVLALTIAALTGVAAWRTWRRPGLLLPAGVAGVLLLLYKHSFMRQDIHHAHMGPMVATATGILFAPFVWRAAGQRIGLAAVVTTCIAAAFTWNLVSAYTGEEMLSVVARRTGENVAAATRLLTDPGRLRREWQVARQNLRDENPLPVEKIAGAVDVYPHRQDVVFAYDLHYKPRPVVSSLVATSPVLAEVNAAHLRGPDAPRTVLFDVELVDRNFPTILDGASLPELLTRYDVADTSGAMLVLHRSATPRTHRFTPLLERTARFDEPVEIPAPTDAPIWVHVRFKKRLPGRLMATLYKPATVGIGVHTRHGEPQSYQLLPSLAAEQGFLLSPLISDRAAYAKLSSAGWQKELSANVVTSVKFFVAAGSQEMSFEPEFGVELSRLEIYPQPRSGDGMQPGGASPGRIQ
jgi:hypothetical protein